MKLLDKYQDMEKIIIAMRGWTGAVDTLNREKNDYLLYKNKLMEADIEQKESFDILELLINIGFPVDEMGTYLYKNMIEEINMIINDFGPTKVSEVQKVLEDELSNKMSLFYTELAARLNLSPIAFNRLIKYAAKQVDKEKVNNNLIIEIFGENFDPIKYPVMAVYIVNYLRINKKVKDGYQNLEYIHL